MFAKVRMINHGLDHGDIGKVYCYHQGLFQPITHDLIITRDYGDWTVIASMIDADNFECWTGEAHILNMATFEKMNKFAEITLFCTGVDEDFNPNWIIEQNPIETMRNINMTEQELKDIHSFTWDAKCTEDQIARMQALREAGKALCEQIIRDVPNSADRSAGIRSLRLAVMQCNSAIAHEGYKP